MTTKERCPKCAERGQDTRGDNLAVYPDGHKYCFACHYREGVPKWERIRESNNTQPVVEVDSKSLQFPEDYTTDLANAPIHWLKFHQITDKEIEEHRMGWSESQRLLIFPLFNGNGELVAWQGRSFDPSKKIKYISHGPIHKLRHFVGISSSVDNTVILVEDLISAIRIGRFHTAMPLWGTHIPLELITDLAAEFRSVGVWLDSDKTDYAIKAVLRASQIMPAFLITSALDPKTYSDQQIQEFIGVSYLEKYYKTLNPELTVDQVMKIVCRKLSYAEASRRYPQFNLNLSDYMFYKNSMLSGTS